MLHPTPIQRTVVSAFIVFNLIAILCWAFPVDTQLFPAVNHHTYYYMNLSGLSQGWSLFAPNPPNSNCRMSAEIAHAGRFDQPVEFPNAPGFQ